MSDEVITEKRGYELRIDGQTAGRFMTVTGLDAGSETGDTSFALHRAITVTLRDGHLTPDYIEWLTYGRSQVGHHGEIVGPAASGGPTLWSFTEGWPAEAAGKRVTSDGHVALRSLVLEIEGVVSAPARSAASSSASAPTSELRPRIGLWQRLFRRRS